MQISPYPFGSTGSSAPAKATRARFERCRQTRKAARLVIALTFATFVSSAADAATLVACVGDSITQNSGWSDRLGLLLGAAYKANNYGVSGTTLLKKGDAPYWNTAAFTQSHAVGPGIVIIMLGTNDSKPQNWGPHSADFVGDYEALIDSYSALPTHPRIFVNLCPPAGVNGYGISGAVIETQINPLIRQVATAKGVGLIDVFSAFGGHNFDPTLYGSTGDQVHPNAAGAQRIADTVVAALAIALDGGAIDAASDAGADDAALDATAADATLDAAALADAAQSEAGLDVVASPETGVATGASGAGDAAATGSSGATGNAATSGSGSAGAPSSASSAPTTPSHVGGSGCSLSEIPSRGGPLALGWLVALAALGRRRRRSVRRAGR